ncbi:MAG: hypothetical protein AMXMBFR81_19130 [Chthonomonas sp.]
MTASPLRVYENDILGNRTSQTLAAKHNWDLLNRMSATANISTGGARYEYRADGMRVLKVEGLSLVWVEEAENEEEEQEEGSGYWDEYWNTNKPTTRYYYEGQMGIEEDYTRTVGQQSETDVTRYGLGARGIDFLEVDAYNASPLAKYPLYDGHGNMIATLTKGSGGTYQVSARRYTDPWGVTRVGASTGSPDQRYCANLGHRQDDESGLTYMRARYYEPTTGRFISEDPARDGLNWFLYCSSQPASAVDYTGRVSIPAYVGALWLFAMSLSGHSVYYNSRTISNPLDILLCSALKAANETFFVVVMGLGDKALLKGAEMALAEASSAWNKGAAAIAVLMAAAYSLMMIAAMLTLDDTIEASLFTR